MMPYSVTAGLIGIGAIILAFIVGWLIDATAPKRAPKQPPQDSAERGWYPPLVPGDGESVWANWEDWNRAHLDEPQRKEKK